MTDLNSALHDLKSRIADSGFRIGLVEDVAEEWDVRPELLTRKFHEATGKAPADFAVVDLSSVIMARAKQIAVEWRSTDFTGSGSVLGKLFSCDGLDLVAAAWTSQGLHCVRVDNGERWIVTFPNRAAAAAYVSRI